MLDKENFNSQSQEFFQYISNNNIAEIKKFFRNENIKPWEFLYDGDLSGIKIFNNIIY